MSRQKFLAIYFPVSLIIGLVIFFGLKFYSDRNFTSEKFNQLVYAVSSSKDKTDDLCKYQILGEPKVADQYLKINFWCQNSSKARSTLSLAAIEDQTISGVLHEYARIINFDYSLIKQNNWYCLFNDTEITDFNQKVSSAGTIDCFENKNLYRHDQKEF